MESKKESDPGEQLMLDIVAINQVCGTTAYAVLFCCGAKCFDKFWVIGQTQIIVTAKRE